jgi:hypothetical protein
MLCFTILVIACGGYGAWVTSSGVLTVEQQQSALGFAAAGVFCGMIIATIGLWLTKDGKP